MLITYCCKNCNKSRYFTSVQSTTVNCKDCNSEMLLKRGDVSSSIMTTEESRFLGDEAIYNTVGRQVAAKRSKHYAGK